MYVVAARKFAHWLVGRELLQTYRAVSVGNFNHLVFFHFVIHVFPHSLEVSVFIVYSSE
jgi:hypothetical protein